MNGTILDEIKKTIDQKKREKLKFITAIITTNLLVAITCLNLNPPGAQEIKKTTSKILHDQYQMVVLPLSVLVVLSALDKETPVTLLDKNKKIIIQKAYLHEELKSSNHALGSAAHFKIEISKADTLKLSANGEDQMIAIPEIREHITKIKNLNQRASPYEISL